jgi:hypothetical protein
LRLAVVEDYLVTDSQPEGLIIDNSEHLVDKGIRVQSRLTSTNASLLYMNKCVQIKGGD